MEATSVWIIVVFILAFAVNSCFKLSCFAMVHFKHFVPEPYSFDRVLVFNQAIYLAQGPDLYFQQLAEPL